MKFSYLSVIIFINFFYGCGDDISSFDLDTSLVEVGAVVITAPELDQFVRDLPQHLQVEDHNNSKYRSYLQNLVDRELILLAAKRNGVDRMAELSHILSVGVNERISNELSRELVDQHVSIDESELIDVYNDFDLGWQVWPAHILSVSEEDALKVVAELESGISFSEVAKTRSIADDASNGGNLGGFFGEGDVVPSLREATFHLEEGQFSGPIRTKDGFEVVKVLKKRRLEFKAMRQKIAKQLTSRKWAERREAVIDSLSEAQNLVYFRDRLPDVLDGLFHRGLTTEQASDTLIAYDGGRILVGDAVRGLRSIKKGALPPDSTAVVTEIYRWILPDSLFALVGRIEGRDRFPRMVQWREKRQRALMVSQVRKDRVAGLVDISEEEIKEYYNYYLETYRKLPGIIRMTEVIVEEKNIAETIAQRAKRGESLNLLAARYSIRNTMKPLGGHTFTDSGRIKIESLYQSPYRDFFGDSNEDQVGLIQGPLLVQDLYSVFRLDQPYGKEPVPFKQVRRPIRVKLREAREGEIFADYLDSLRTASSHIVQWKDAAIGLYGKYKLQRAGL